MVYNFFLLSLDSFADDQVSFNIFKRKKKKKKKNRSKRRNFTLQLYILFCSKNIKIVTLKGVKSGIFYFFFLYSEGNIIFYLFWAHFLNIGGSVRMGKSKQQLLFTPTYTIRLQK